MSDTVEKVKKVERWQTTDGSLFVGMFEATEHQIKIDKMRVLENWVEKYFAFLDCALKTDVVETLGQHGKEIKDVL